MGNLIKAAILSFKISFMLVLALWLLLAMGVELVPWSFFGWMGYLAMFLFIGYNCYLWFISKEEEREAAGHA